MQCPVYQAGDIVLLQPYWNASYGDPPDTRGGGLVWGMVCGRMGEYYRILLPISRAFARHDMVEGLFVQWIPPAQIVYRIQTATNIGT